MSLYVQQGNHPIAQETRETISMRYKAITKAVNREFWNSESETAHSRYVGSYGRGTAIDTSDLDVLIELPNDEYKHFQSLKRNSQSRLLQAVKNAVIAKYRTTNISADGQVVVVKFSDGMKFEILPTFQQTNPFNGFGGYIYPDTNMGGNWLSTNPKAEQEAMANKNNESNGLLFDTCKHIRFVKSEYFSSYHLSGILIDSFVYWSIRNYHWLHDNEYGENSTGEYENALLNCYNNCKIADAIPAPGSCMRVSMADWGILGKILNKMVW